MSAAQEPVARMAVPSPGGGCGVIGCVLFVVPFVGSFVALAIDNLIHYATTPIYGLIPSVLWLALVAFVIFATFWEMGIREPVVCTLGEFSLSHFVEVVREGDRLMIGFGYRLFGRRFYYVRIEREQITSVNMNSGQATGLAGRDANDWHVTVWYRDPHTPTRKPFPGVRHDEELHIITPSRAKATTEEWFRAFVAFLITAGIDLHPTPVENEFCTHVSSA